MKKSLLFLSSLLLFFCLLIFPARTFFYACEGVNLWFHTILPSLLPFLILTSLLLETGAARRISARAEVFFQTVFGLSPAGFYALFLGLFCGFPMGARITAQLYEAEEIDRNEACYLLTFCSSPSPCFSVFLCYLNCVFRTDPSRVRLRRALRFQFSNWFSVPACFPPLPPAPAHRPSDTFRGKKRDVKTDFQRKPAGHLYHERI